jgi:hypothetical protein
MQTFPLASDKLMLEIVGKESNFSVTRREFRVQEKQFGPKAPVSILFPRLNPEP